VKFEPTGLEGSYVVVPERSEDVRGFFARTFCREEFSEMGLETTFVQCSISNNHKRGTLRGLHYQAAPHEETKLVRCTRGAIYDVVVDLREKSPTRGKWIGVELSAQNAKALYVPKGLAHGFQTLMDATDVFYQISVPYHATHSRVLRWNDPLLGIAWPVPNPILIERDGNAPSMSDGT
jgi:dTDP-4-dehydrorhamnose 3,5-epimerase